MLTSNNFLSGLNTDVHPKNQPDGTYRLALNAVVETGEGDISKLINELGNSLCNALPEGKSIHGHTLTDTNDVILLLYDPEGIHELGIYNSAGCTYTPLLYGEC